MHYALHHNCVGTKHFLVFIISKHFSTVLSSTALFPKTNTSVGYLCSVCVSMAHHFSEFRKPFSAQRRGR